MHTSDGGGGYPAAIPAPTGGREVRVDHDRLYDVYRRLQADLDELAAGGPGTVTWFQSGLQGRVTQDDLGHYPAAEAVAMTCSNAESHTGRVYADFVQAYQDLADVVKQSAENYRAAEGANQQSVDNVGQSVDNTGNVQSWG